MDAGKVPTGAILPVVGTALDFRAGKPLAEADTGQLDHNFVLTPADQRNWREKPAATLEAPDRSMRLRLWTDQPAMQVYTGGGLGALEVG
jgi:aldose 1-epimerase